MAIKIEFLINFIIMHKIWSRKELWSIFQVLFYTKKMQCNFKNKNKNKAKQPYLTFLFVPLVSAVCRTLLCLLQWFYIKVMVWQFSTAVPANNFTSVHSTVGKSSKIINALKIVETSTMFSVLVIRVCVNSCVWRHKDAHWLRHITKAI